MRRELVGTVLAIVLGLLAGALVMVVFDPTQISNVPRAYAALLRGGLGSPKALAETLATAAPLICAGLGISLAFAGGLFNVGAQGQAIVGASLAAYVGFAWTLPGGVHLIVGLLAGLLGGTIWGALAGWLRARFGAHEVITTIMANYIAAGLLTFALTTPTFQRPGRGDAIAPLVHPTAALPGLGRAHLGVLIALGAALLVGWLTQRSRAGLEIRAVGFNPVAAGHAGIAVEATIVRTMAISGLLAGLAGAIVALAPDVHGRPTPLSDSLVGSVGWDAIAVAMLGRGRPAGVVAAGLFVGALRAGSLAMQAQAGTGFDLATVIQAVIMLVVATPALLARVGR
ncbi:MAG: ABC transporter permease [Brooklawnia sp.]|jgi:ABC-type uncharacterized transport system permease subunit